MTRTHAQVRAFTLVEIMISMALLAIIIVGVNFVFRTTADTIGTGQALGEAIRAQKAVQSVLQQDFQGYDPDDDTNGMVPTAQTPFIHIYSQRVAAFRDRRDMLATPGYDPNETDAGLRDQAIRTIDGIERSPAIYNHRNHRIDTISFFSRGFFERQTANDNDGFVADMFSDYAYVWYGHLKLPHNPTSSDWTSANYMHPGEQTLGTNANNSFATDWKLGRMAILLREPEADGRIYDRQGNAQRYIGRSPNADAMSMAPLSVNSNSTVDGTVGSFGPPNIPSSRFDLAGISLPDYRTLVEDRPTTWWANGRFTYRFQANPFPLKPYEPEDMARLSPILLNHSTQFIVEYAGDFMIQNPIGQPTAAGQDGQIDFVVVDNVRQIRWYGFPRDVDGDGRIPGGDGPAADLLDSPDVVPLRDLLALVAQPPASFERNGPVMRADYAADDPDGLGFDEVYLVAWGPTEFDAGIKPSLIRIIVTVADGQGRLAEGYTQEYVFRVP